MALLGGATKVAARVGRTKSNALTVELKDGAGGVIATAKQKGSAGVLFGFKNGGRSSYTLTAGDTDYTLDVAGTATFGRDGLPLGRIVPFGGNTGCRFEDGGGTTLANLTPYVGLKGDDPWVHPIAAPDGSPLGTLSLWRSHTTFMDLYDETFLWDKAAPLKFPTVGAALELAVPVPEVLGDVLVAACVDICVLPRGYIAK